MLQAVRGYKIPIIDFHNDNIASDTDKYLTPIDFEIANNIFKILSVIEMATNSLSGTYYPTAHLLLLTIDKLHIKCMLMLMIILYVNDCCDANENFKVL